MNPEEVLDLVGELASLKYFPSDPSARIAIARLAASMANDRVQLRRLISRMTNGSTYGEWPGPAEMRACFCSMFKPKDGIEASSTVYPDGIPSERPEPASMLAWPDRKRLEAGEPVSKDASANSLVFNLAPEKHLKRRLVVIERLQGIPPATADEIEKIKTIQAAAARNDATREILANPGLANPANVPSSPARSGRKRRKKIKGFHSQRRRKQP